MTSLEKTELLTVLAKNYLYEKEQDYLWNREHSISYGIALGKLQGVCMVLGVDFEETNKDLTVFTQNRKKIICKVIYE